MLLSEQYAELDALYHRLTAKSADAYWTCRFRRRGRVGIERVKPFSVVLEARNAAFPLMTWRNGQRSNAMASCSPSGNRAATIMTRGRTGTSRQVVPWRFNVVTRSGLRRDFASSSCCENPGFTGSATTGDVAGSTADHDACNAGWALKPAVLWVIEGLVTGSFLNQGASSRARFAEFILKRR